MSLLEEGESPEIYRSVSLHALREKVMWEHSEKAADSKPGREALDIHPDGTLILDFYPPEDKINLLLKPLVCGILLRQPTRLIQATSLFYFPKHVITIEVERMLRSMRPSWEK